MTNTKLLLECTDIAILVCNVVILLIMWKRSLVAKFPTVAGYLFIVVATESLQIPLLFFRKALGLDIDFAYRTFFYSNIVSFALMTVIMILVVYSVFNSAMSPMKGLQRIGSLVFRWVAGVSVLLSAAMTLGPQLFSSSDSATAAVTNIFQRVQEGVNVLTLCLLLFVCFAIRPLGLTFRSHIFGVTLGLGVISTGQLIEAAWYSTAQAHQVYSPMYVVSGMVCLIAFAIWGTYFALPEPARVLIVLPTTSPFFHWNRIAEALGDAPGNVAIGFNASMISPVETKMMTAMSKRNREREAAAAKAEAEEHADSLFAS